MPHIRSEVISGKYVVQYIFAAAATAAVEPLISSIGVGWTFTICKFDFFRDYTTTKKISNMVPGVFFALIGGCFVWAITKWGINMQRWVEEKLGEDEKPT